MNFSFLLTGKLGYLARERHHSLVDVFVIRHVLDDHAGGHQPLTVIIRNLKSKLILQQTSIHINIQPNITSNNNSV